MRPVPDSSEYHFRTALASFTGAATDPYTRQAAGEASRAWVEAEHGYGTLGPLYMVMFEQAARHPAGSASVARPSDAAAPTRKNRIS